MECKGLHFVNRLFDTLFLWLDLKQWGQAPLIHTQAGKWKINTLREVARFGHCYSSHQIQWDTYDQPLVDIGYAEPWSDSDLSLQHNTISSACIRSNNLSSDGFVREPADRSSISTIASYNFWRRNVDVGYRVRLRDGTSSIVQWYLCQKTAQGKILEIGDYLFWKCQAQAKMVFPTADRMVTHS